MSKFLTNAAVIDFDSEVKHAYQGMGNLRNCVTIRTGVTGESYKFTRMGAGIANQKATQADVTPMDIEHARQTAVLENWLAPEYTDIFDQAEVNFDEKTELAQTIAKALSRREDQLIIDAMNAVTYVASNPTIDQGTAVNTGTAFNVATLRAASAALSDLGVPESDRYIAYTAADRESLLGEEEATSSDFNTVKALVQGEIDTFVGFKFKLIETRQEGGLPANSVFAWHKASVGYAVGIDMKTTIDWVAQKTSWLCNGMLKSGAVAREGRGLVKITTA
ncbi:MAG: hypothetical protein GY746_10825 [Gammaproteobacteria bacterium]|nr:hypothetical protein [Gammaproteobacteria bacterium]